MRVRPAARADLPGLGRLAVAHEHLARYAAEPARIGSALERGIGRGDVVVVAERVGRVEGFAWWQPSGAFGRSPYLRLLVVAAGATGAGIGGALMDAVEAGAAGLATDLFLLVSADNDGARRFYEARGYEVQGRIEAYVLDDVDEVLLRRRLRR